ncbi:MAG: aminoglycoside phosphotransferase family protein [Methylovirgula sp.]|nr:aminoglycoside phosphotransferase family protein [Methylovirgula sp.]
MAKAKLEKYRAAILRAFPQLVTGTFKLVTDGWDSAAVDVDGKLIFKFPRSKAARQALRREAAILAVARPALSLAVPDLQLHEGPPLFSSHLKLKGRQIEAEDYAKLPEAARERLGENLARFYAELHALEPARMKLAGAVPIAPWHEPETVRARALPLVPHKRARLARNLIEAYENLPPDPYGAVFGFFDGHGWNMAFDRKKARLRGIYDFADSGFGALHQEFIYSDLISPDLTGRIVRAYEELTGRALERRRIDILSGYHHLSELADFAEDRARAKEIRRDFKVWAREHADFAA